MEDTFSNGEKIRKFCSTLRLKKNDSTFFSILTPRMNGSEVFFSHFFLILVNHVKSAPTEKHSQPRHDPVQFGIGVSHSFFGQGCCPHHSNHTWWNANVDTKNNFVGIDDSNERCKKQRRCWMYLLKGFLTEHHQKGMPREVTPSSSFGASSGVIPSYHRLSREHPE